MDARVRTENLWTWSQTPLGLKSSPGETARERWGRARCLQLTVVPLSVLVWIEYLAHWPGTPGLEEEEEGNSHQSTGNARDVIVLPRVTGETEHHRGLPSDKSFISCRFKAAQPCFVI